jgi:hypothetical protein
MILFGGALTTAVTNEVWQLRWLSDRSYELCSLAVDEDGDGLSGCADPDCWASCTPLCPPAASCDPNWPRCGDNTCDPRETCRTCPADCGACAPACGDHFCDPGETVATCKSDCP